MREDFLQFIWRTRRFNHRNLFSTAGEAIEIIRPGHYNRDAGPDFQNARIKIGTTLWVGQVEIHLRSSEWKRHRHQENKAYDSVILHVVMKEDIPIYRSNGSRIPCLELRSHISRAVLSRYQYLLENISWIPCAKQVEHVAPLTIHAWLDRLLVERLEQQTRLIAQRLELNGNDWELTFYQYLARSFGLKVNMDPFEQLARNTPLLLLWKHKGSLFQIEALLFGQSGLLLDSQEEDYPKRLKREYEFLQRKYGLEPMSGVAWKFFRMRPNGFPTIRIAQFARFIYQTDHLFSKILAIQNVEEIIHLFDIKLSGYWTNHYRFNQVAPQKKKVLGKATIQRFIINTIVPFFFLYGSLRVKERYKQLALDLLEELGPESNRIVRQWALHGVKALNAAQSQGLLQLKKNYCDRKRCLDCAIGTQLLK